MERLSENQTIRAEGTTGLSRRAFLKHGGGAAIGLAVVPAAGLAATSPPQPTLSASFSNLGQDLGKTLMRMARDIFPHEKLHDKYYAAVVNPYDQKAATDAAFKKLLSDGVNDLNRRSMKRFGKTYAEILSEGDRVVILYDIEQSAFFQKLRGDLLYGIYNNKEVWSQFGYEGSSWEKGGYIERGFNNIDWL
ncbi:gluconate 2-dehydrogenase subunit 3 family protein [Aromatoleum diolicum]|uniref:Gluconate 2-dehydrogenase subunit 3 family protein n=1 Tax=Aromatoleum diolicum TaxID=75796 RepID=A0ABX1Q863_9RHOO|nr:gluconate 2-dehydrogenase subunit 3 family protein [Aromatoleum diolicum]